MAADCLQCRRHEHKHGGDPGTADHGGDGSRTHGHGEYEASDRDRHKQRPRVSAYPDTHACAQHRGRRVAWPPTAREARRGDRPPSRPRHRVARRRSHPSTHRNGSHDHDQGKCGQSPEQAAAVRGVGREGQCHRAAHGPRQQPRLPPSVQADRLQGMAGGDRLPADVVVLVHHEVRGCCGVDPHEPPGQSPAQDSGRVHA